MAEIYKTAVFIYLHPTNHLSRHVEGEFARVKEGLEECMRLIARGNHSVAHIRLKHWRNSLSAIRMFVGGCVLIGWKVD